jgi:formiminotetrahydrofolate cyclodeaminase
MDSDPEALEDVEVDHQPLGAFLDQLAARLPAPGAGATAAIEAALAASLVAMVGRFTGDDGVAREIVAAADAERAACLEAAAADEVAFPAVTRAMKLPQDTAEQEEHRRRELEAAQREAARPPQAVIRSAAALITLAEQLLPIANRNLLSDVAAATAAARAAATTARLAVEVNLGRPVDGVDDLVRRADAVEAAVREQVP